MFHNRNLHFPTVTAFADWLATQPRSDWKPIGSVFHNTYSPNETQWRGLTSLASMQTFYAAKGWDRGPHLYLAAGTADDGIFIMTPPHLPGIHAGMCNSNRFGIEVVGDFAARPMSDAQLTLLVEAAAALHRWAGCGPNIVAHRDCMPGRTCPGNAAYAQKPAIQARLSAALPPREATYTADSPIIPDPALPPADPTAILNNWTFARSGYRVWDVTVILSSYCEQAERVGIDPILAIAQMSHETGNLSSFWAQRPQRNPAGIGVTGLISDIKPDAPDWAYDPAKQVWRAGNTFESWTNGSIPAHLGRLLAYALPVGGGTPAQQALITLGLTYRPLPLAVRGCAPTLAGLDGTWAVPGVDYGQKIADIANRLVEAS